MFPDTFTLLQNEGFLMQGCFKAGLGGPRRAERPSQSVPCRGMPFDPLNPPRSPHAREDPRHPCRVKYHSQEPSMVYTSAPRFDRLRQGYAPAGRRLAVTSTTLAPCTWAARGQRQRAPGPAPSPTRSFLGLGVLAAVGTGWQDNLPFYVIDGQRGRVSLGLRFILEPLRGCRIN